MFRSLARTTTRAGTHGADPQLLSTRTLRVTQVDTVHSTAKGRSKAASGTSRHALSTEGEGLFLSDTVLCE